MTTTDEVRAACLTPPAAGGIAIVQIVGKNIPDLLAPCLKSPRPLDLAHMDESQLRLCRLVDGNETIDDVVICVRRESDGVTVAELTMHGGPRIVQRVLLLLKRMGVRITEGKELLAVSWSTTHPLEQEILDALLQAKTRFAAAWIARMKHALPNAIDPIVRTIQAGDMAAARSDLETLLSRSRQARFLLEGIRVVLIGEPNTGKSTLANALAQREHAIVSDTPGTTRDWVEHPTAIEGVPVTLVDTAGIRETHDRIEQEAIHRTQDQIRSANVVMIVIDASALQAAPQNDRANRLLDHAASTQNVPDRLLVFNKSDCLTAAQKQGLLAQRGPDTLLVSAQTGNRLDTLRHRLIQSIGWTQGLNDKPAPFTDRQIDLCRQALSAMAATEPDLNAAIDRLHFLVGRA